MRIAESHLMVSVRTFGAQQVLPRSIFLWILLHFASLHLGLTLFNKSWIQQQIWSMVSKPWVNLSIWFPHSIENIGNILTPISRATWQTETPDYPKHIVFFAATNVAVLGASGTSMRNFIHIRSSLVRMKQNTHGDRLWQIVHDIWHTICIIAQHFFVADRFSYVLNSTEASTNHLKVTSMMQTNLPHQRYLFWLNNVKPKYPYISIHLHIHTYPYIFTHLPVLLPLFPTPSLLPKDLLSRSQQHRPSLASAAWVSWSNSKRFRARKHCSCRSRSCRA